MSKQVKHTPGPWADAQVTKANDPKCVIIYVNYEWPSRVQQAEDIANARLIAAAPDLLAAVENVLAVFADDADPPVFVASLKRAAKKAKSG